MFTQCTGIWIWGEPIQCTLQDGEECACIILDTEGLGGVESNLKYDSRIFSLVILLCSTLIYNSMGSIDENAISNLSLVTQLSENISLTAKKDGENEDDALNFHKVFLSFVWVIRDFTLELEDEDGYEITPTQYLNNCLLQSPGGFNDKKAMERNRIRHMLTSFFPDRECVTLVRPVSDEEALQQVDSLEYNDLREEFRDGMSQLRDLIFKNSKPKTIDNKTLTGHMFCGIVRSYVNAINEGGIPTISSAWESVSSQECEDAKEESIRSYKSQCRSAFAKMPFPVEELELQRVHDETVSKVKHEFYQKAVGPSLKIAEEGLKVELSKACSEFVAENIAASESFCNKFLVQSFDSVFQKNLDLVDNEECLYARNLQIYRDHWNDVLKSYHDAARGPQKWCVLSTFLKSQMIDCTEVIVESMSKKFNKKIELLQDEVHSFTTQNSTLEAELHVLKDKAEKTEKRNKELEESVIDLKTKCSAQEKSISESTNKYSELLRNYDEEKDLRSRQENKLERSQKRLMELESIESTCYELRQDNSSQASTIKELEEEVAALKTKKKKCVIS